MGAMTRRQSRREPEPYDLDEEGHDAAPLRARLFAALRRRPVLLALAGLFVFAAVSVNALYLQDGPHPAPLFGRPTQVASLGGLPSPVPGSFPPESEAEETDAGPVTPPDNLVADIQIALKERGLYRDTVDGMNGPATAAAISAYERRMGLEVTGAPSVALLASLSTPAGSQASKPDPDTSPPPSRTTVTRLQEALVAEGYGPITVDGIYGSETAGAIRRYELDHGLSVTGSVSDPLLARLGVVAAAPEG